MSGPKRLMPLRERTFAASFWLLLAVILGHALLPVGAPLAKSAGSAFSPVTADVSLGATRRDGRAAETQQVDPPADPSALAAVAQALTQCSVDCEEPPAPPTIRVHTSLSPSAPRAPPVGPDPRA